MGLTAAAVQDRVDSTLGSSSRRSPRRRSAKGSNRVRDGHKLDPRDARTSIAKTVGPVMVTAVCVYAPVVGALAFTYREISPWTAFLFLAPALAAQQLFSLYQQKARLYEEQLTLYADLKVANTRLTEANLSFATALVQTLEESDRYTAGHSRAVATYSRDIAEKLGLPTDEVETDLSLGPCTRHRKDRTARDALEQGGAAHTRRVPRDGASFRDRRAHSLQG